MAKPWDVRGFDQDLRRAARGFTKTATAARRIGFDPGTMKVLRMQAALNNREVFATRGAAADLDWRGYSKAEDEVTGRKFRRVHTDDRLLDYEETGDLRKFMTTAGAMLATVGANRITFRPPVKYWRFVRPAYGWIERYVDEMAVKIEEILVSQGRW